MDTVEVRGVFTNWSLLLRGRWWNDKNYELFGGASTEFSGYGRLQALDPKRLLKARTLFYAIVDYDDDQREINHERPRARELH